MIQSVNLSSTSPFSCRRWFVFYSRLGDVGRRARQKPEVPAWQALHSGGADTTSVTITLLGAQWRGLPCICARRSTVHRAICDEHDFDLASCSGSTAMLQEELSPACAEGEDDWRQYIRSPPTKRPHKRTSRHDAAAAAAEVITAFKKGSYTSGDGTTVKLRQYLRRGRSAIALYEHPPLAPLATPPAQPVDSCDVVVYGDGSFEAAEWLVRRSLGHDIAVLDFASDSNPGGGWRGKQVGTQEEALCRASNLGLLLESSMPEGGLPGLFAAIYCPEVVVIRDRAGQLKDSPFVVAVIAAALRCCSDDGSSFDQKQTRFVEEKITSVLKIAYAHGRRQLVLGAWGCGAFGNPPGAVARAFVNVLRRTIDAGFVKKGQPVTFLDVFERVVFAIPPGQRFDAFCEELQLIEARVVFMVL